MTAGSTVPRSKTKTVASAHPCRAGSQFDGEQRAGADDEVELLPDLAHDAGGRGLVPVDDAARQVPLALVDELAQEHVPRARSQDALGDGPLGRQGRVEHRREALLRVRVGVVAAPAEHDGVLAHAAQGRVATQVPFAP